MAKNVAAADSRRSLGQVASSPLVPACIAQEWTMEVMSRLMDARHQLAIAVGNNPKDAFLRALLEEVNAAIKIGRDVNRSIDTYAAPEAKTYADYRGHTIAAVTTSKGHTLLAISGPYCNERVSIGNQYLRIDGAIKRAHSRALAA